ncbi:hypothetical protein [Propionibacterium freudenreichii]|nr:hypothetical protein [Propionibacterium freudenreichii]
MREYFSLANHPIWPSWREVATPNGATNAALTIPAAASIHRRLPLVKN